MDPWMGLNGVDSQRLLSPVFARASHGLGDVLSTVASFDPEPISNAAINLVSTIENVLGIGSGRKEADIIVPIWNQFFATVIAPIHDQVFGPNASELTQQQLNVMWSAFETGFNKYDSFLLTTTWSDGRAATQAYNDSRPWRTTTEAQMQLLLKTAPYSIAQAIGGVPPIPGLIIPGTTGTTGIPGSPLPPVSSALSSSTMYLLIGGVVLVLLMGRQKN